MDVIYRNVSVNLNRIAVKSVYHNSVRFFTETSMTGKYVKFDFVSHGEAVRALNMIHSTQALLPDDPTLVLDGLFEYPHEETHV